MAATANIGLQRTAPCGLAAEAGSFARRKSAIAPVIVSVILAISRIASACDCFEPQFTPENNPKKAVAGAEAVFAGEVVSIEKRPGAQLVRFRVSEAWKGVENPDVTVTTYGDGECFAFEFVTGKKYLVFADRSSGGLHTGQCMNNRWIWREYELRYMRNWRAGKKFAK